MIMRMHRRNIIHYLLVLAMLIAPWRVFAMPLTACQHMSAASMASAVAAGDAAVHAHCRQQMQQDAQDSSAMSSLHMGMSGKPCCCHHAICHCHCSVSIFANMPHPAASIEPVLLAIVRADVSAQRFDSRYITPPSHPPLI